MPKASKKPSKTASLKAAAKKAPKVAAKKAAVKKPAIRLAPAPKKAAPKVPPKTQQKAKPQIQTKASEPVGMWKLLADKKAQAEARRDGQNDRPHAHDDERARFAKHDTRFAKFSGPRRRAS